MLPLSLGSRDLEQKPIAALNIMQWISSRLRELEYNIYLIKRNNRGLIMTTNKIIKPILASLMVGLACSAMAADAPKSEYNYVGLRGGVIVPSSIQGNSDLKGTTPETTYTAGIAFGRQLTERFGAELEYTYRGKNKIESSVSAQGSQNYTDTWAVQANTFMINGIANLLEEKQMVMPYLKAGVGISNNKSDDYVNTTNNNSGLLTRTWKGKSKSVFAWQAAFGLNVATNDMIDTNFEYAYINRGKFETHSDQYSNPYTDDTPTIPSTAKTGYLKEQVVTIGFKVKF